MANTPPPIDDFWPAYGNSEDFVEVECEGPSGSLAAHVMEVFDVPMASSASSIGDNLKGLDIKHMDALAVVNLSLLAHLAESGSLSGGAMFEAIVNAEGEVEFVEIGGDSASLSDIYYQVQSATYIETCTGVIVRGGKALPKWKPTAWDLIWKDSAFRYVHDVTDMVSNCTRDNFSTHAVIIFNDPNLENSEFNDGINNLYNLRSPYEKILGYAKFIDAPGSTDDTKVTYNNSATIPIRVQGTDNSGGPDMGTLVPPPTYDPAEEGYGSDCWKFKGSEVDASLGIKIPLPEHLRYDDVRGTTVDKFRKVEEVYIVGQKLSMVKSAPIYEDAVAAQQEPTDFNTKAIITIENTTEDTFKLSEGKDYVISYEEESVGGSTFKVPYIVFAKNARMDEPKAYGKNTKYVISQAGRSGVYRQGDEGIGTIFPVAENRGFLVTEIWAMVGVETPSISVFDPENNEKFGQGGKLSKANIIAENLKYYVKPLVVEEPPPAIAFNGKILDQIDGAPDNDPTTVQDFEDTDLEIAMDEMAKGGGGLEITLPFFNEKEDERKLENISKNLFEFMNNGTGVETTYVCGPNTDVELGQSGPSGGIINNITYSYTDSGSYTISVNEGPRLVKPPAGGGPAGPTMKASETFNSRGTVIQNLGNGIHFKVRIDGYGERVAINMSSSIIRVGDVVSCSVHNNPVED